MQWLINLTNPIMGISKITDRVKNSDSNMLNMLVLVSCVQIGNYGKYLENSKTFQGICLMYIYIYI